MAAGWLARRLCQRCAAVLAEHDDAGHLVEPAVLDRRLAAGRPVMMAIVPVSGASARRARWPRGQRLGLGRVLDDGRQRAVEVQRDQRPARVGEQRGQPDPARPRSHRQNPGSESIPTPDPRRLSRLWPELQLELFGCAELAAGGPATTEPGDKHRVELGRRRGVDQFVEQLVVPGRRKLEYFEDLAFFGAVRSPQAPFKCQECAFRDRSARTPQTGPSSPASPPPNMVCHGAI